ncbi:MAG: HlyD family efflux transporter periplasmic adaptor subunit, partial [Pseudomonadota bacterium]
EIQILEAAKKIEEFDSQTQSELRQAKADLNLELAEVEQGLADFGGRSARLTMTAPASGVVKGLTVNAVNAVVQAGETVLEIVPIAERMVVSAQVSPAEVSRVQPGQPASVRVAAYDSSSYGSLDGVVELVSASTFQDERGETFYRAIISLEKAHFGEDPARNKVLPGMSVQADIKTGSKSILGYLLKPVSRGWSNAFHER